MNEVMVKLTESWPLLAVYLLGLGGLSGMVGYGYGFTDKGLVNKPPLPIDKEVFLRYGVPYGLLGIGLGALGWWIMS